MGVFLAFGIDAPFGVSCGLSSDGASRGDGFGKIGDGRASIAVPLAVSTS
jgi:hypothetical protein